MSESKSQNPIEHKENLIRFGQRVKKVRVRLNLKQKDFAESIGLSSGYISEIESGKTRATYDFFYNIVEVYRINPLYLLTGEPPVILEARRRNFLSDPDYEKDPGEEIILEMLELLKKYPDIRYALYNLFYDFVYNNRERFDRELTKMQENIEGTAKKKK